MTSPFSHFRFSDEAQAVFIEWSGDMHRMRIPNEDEPIIRQHLAKFDKLFPALALVFHLVDCAAHGVCGPVSKEAALRAAAWCEYLEAHARRCYGLLKDDAPPTALDEEAARAGVTALLAVYPPEQVQTYLNTLWLQDPERWAVLEKSG